jgi:hypothetical protein
MLLWSLPWWSAPPVARTAEFVLLYPSFLCYSDELFAFEMFDPSCEETFRWFRLACCAWAFLLFF